ncbi:hypothetical protein [Enterococcus faecalis]|jgi:hypothetical protein|uniref:hypothetical protein n=1 Tax=Enterococcus TaxID=1350 RepID=UPI00080CA255|nr:hypothetical protein [Enterococcus faecalis]ANU71952.1 hypothetical protein A4V06_02275 [Enterococcus faecalis]ARV05046.1 hypothetical protein A6B47_14195 [Enterococcus faecalis]ASU26652.1 hypothetical protein ADH73_11615 [Enterococcus faecalis]MBG9437161.1 hypothetical protein [Enterococcus faecalis]MBG9439976.1 hypothetical protein [Enterococcus faecalis]
MSLNVIVLLVLLAVQTWLVPRLNNKVSLLIIPSIFFVLSLYVERENLSLLIIIGLMIGFFIYYMAGLTQWDRINKEKQKKYLKEKFFNEK